MWRSAFRFLSVIVLFTTMIWWGKAGASRGWTKNSVAIEKKDEITEIVYTEYEKRFVPGVDFLAAGVGMSLGLGVVSWLFGRRKRAAKSVVGG